MKNLKPIIYTTISVFFLVLTFKLLATDFSNTGFNKTVLLTISALMTIATIAASFKMWATNNDQKELFDINFPLTKWRKLLIASGGIALSIFLIITILGLWFFSPDIVINFVDKYMIVTIVLITIIAMLFVHKHLK